MSPTSTSEPPPLPEGGPLPPAHAPAVPEVPTPAVPLLRGALGDMLLAVLALFGANVLLGAGVGVAYIAPRLLAGERGFGEGDALATEMTPALLVAAVFATLLAALATWWLRARRQPALPTMRPALAYPLAIGAGVVIQLVCLGISMLSAAHGSPLAPSNADPIDQLGRQTPWMMWLIAVVVAPVAEELLFRHVLVRRFALAGRATLGILVTSLLFAAMHEPVPGAQGLVPWLSAVGLYVAMGAGFGVVYVRTGRLGAAIAAHAACNLAALSVTAFSTL